MTWLKLGGAAAVLWYLSRGRPGPCVGKDDYEPCGPGSKCLKGRCVEFQRCADDPQCSRIGAETGGVLDALDDIELDPFGWLSPETWADAEAWFERGMDQVVGAFDARESWTGPVTSTTDPRLDER